MPSLSKSKQPEPKIRRVDRFPGSTLRVSLGDGTSRLFLNAMCSIDEQSNLMITKIDRDDEVSMVILYAPGVWSAVEQVIDAESNTPPN